MSDSARPSKTDRPSSGVIIRRRPSQHRTASLPRPRPTDPRQIELIKRHQDFFLDSRIRGTDETLH